MKRTRLEVWKNGNVAFILTTTPYRCNNEFILNKDDAGLKNQLAVLLVGRRTDTHMRARSYSAEVVRPAHTPP